MKGKLGFSEKAMFAPIIGRASPYLLSHAMVSVTISSENAS